jgi:integrase
MIQSPATYQFTLDKAIFEWLQQKHTRTGSEKTRKAYIDTMRSFRETLQRGGLDLLDNPIDIARVAAIWAGLRTAGAKRQGGISPATYNQRLAILSSFYTFLQDTYHLDTPNPIESVKKRPVQAYASAMPLDADEVTDRLASIDRSTLQGKRDYALLSVALATGRRASELVALRGKHIRQFGKKIVLTFEHCKGDKTMRDTLDPDVAKVLMSYLRAIYGEDLGNLLPESPIWVSFSRQNRGKPVSTHTLNDLCERYLGTSKIHTLRHTFAVEMEKVGAPISEISARLGHTSEKITGIYLKQMRSSENPYASRLAARFGIGKEQE